MRTTIGALLREGGSIKTGPFGTTLKAKEYSQQGVPLISVGEIGDGSLRVRESTPRAPPEVVARLPEYLLEAGDIVFGRKGAVDRSAFIKTEEAGWFLGSDGIRLRLPRSCDARFVAYHFRDPTTRSWLLQHATGTTMASLNQGILERVPIVLPPLREQRAIANVLGTLDDKIELNRRMSETLEAIARALFRSWFVDFDPVRARGEGRDLGLPTRLADVFPARLVDSEVGTVPEGWTARPLSEWVDTLSGGTPSKSEPRYWDGDVPWISPKVMTAIHADEADAHVAESAIGNGTRLAPAGSTLVMVRGMGLHEKVRVSQARRAVTFNQDVKALVGSSIDSTLLLFALLDAQSFLLDRVESSGHGTGKLPTELLLALPVVMPDRSAQKRVSEPLRLMNERIAVARNETRVLAALRDSLLPRLLSGDVAVSRAAKPHEAMAP